MTRPPKPPRVRLTEDQRAALFAACFTNVPIRDQRDTMERPFFSLSKTPRLVPIEYQSGEIIVRVRGVNPFGIATIWDADLLAWCATQLIEADSRGQPTSPTLHFEPYKFFAAIGRSTGGKDYAELRASLRRLASTYVETSIEHKPTKREYGLSGFHWIEKWGEYVDEHGRPAGVSVTLPEWLYHGILNKRSVLSIHRDYFQLTGGLERWLYRVARKHAGRQPEGWQFTMRQLHQKSGSTARFSDFARDIRRVVKADRLPEYTLSLHKDEAGIERVRMRPRPPLEQLEDKP